MRNEIKTYREHKSEARRLQCLGRFYREEGNFAKARRCAELMKAELHLANIIKKRLGAISE